MTCFSSYILFLLLLTPTASRWFKPSSSVRFLVSPSLTHLEIRGGDGVTGISELEDPSDITLLDKINNQGRIDRLLNLAGRIPAIRDSVDSMLHISKAANEDTLLATAVLLKLAQLIRSDEIGEKLLRDRRLEQLLEVVEVQAEPLHAKLIYELILAFSKLKIVPRDLLMALELRANNIISTQVEYSKQISQNTTNVDVVDASWLLQGFGEASYNYKYQTVTLNVTSKCLSKLVISSNMTKSLSSDMLINTAWALTLLNIDPLRVEDGSFVYKEQVIKQLIDMALTDHEEMSSFTLNRLLSSALFHHMNAKHVSKLALDQFIRLKKLFYSKESEEESFNADTRVKDTTETVHMEKDGNLSKKRDKLWYEASSEEKCSLVTLLWRMAKQGGELPEGLLDLILDRILPNMFPLLTNISVQTSSHKHTEDLPANQLAKLGWALTTFAKRSGATATATTSPVEVPLTSLEHQNDHPNMEIDLNMGGRRIGDDATRVVVLAMTKLGPSGGVGVSCEAMDLVDLLWALQERSTALLPDTEGTSIHMTSNHWGLGFDWAATLGRLTVALEASLGSLTTQQVVTVIHAYAALKLRPANLLNLAARRLLSKPYHSSNNSTDIDKVSSDFIDGMTPKEVATVAVAFASMGHPAPLLYTRLAAHVSREATKFAPKDLAKAMWALARAGHELGPLFCMENYTSSSSIADDSSSSSLLPKITETSLSELCPTDLSRLHWAFSSMLIIPPPIPVAGGGDILKQLSSEDVLFGLIHKVIELKLTSFSPTELVDTAWGLTKLRKRQPRMQIIGGDSLLDRVASALSTGNDQEWDLSIFTTHQLARLSWAFANWSGSQDPKERQSSSSLNKYCIQKGISMCVTRTEAVLSIGIEAARRLQQVTTTNRADVYYCGAAQQWHEVYMTAWQANEFVNT